IATGFLLFPQSAQAGFNAGRIIDDPIFTDKNTMSAQDIQNFLNSQVTTCRSGYTCLKDYQEGGRSAAQIIYDTAQTYNINPRVILVTLQKENGLIKDTWPEPWQYRTAMGMGCPDGAPCDSQYYGFTNQVNQGTRHLRGFYDQSPGWFIPFRPGVNTIKWHPNSACGTSSVNIEGRATAALYSYTPYRPNQASLDAGFGTGDNCSSYGNRNFYNYFTLWFGTTHIPEYQWAWVSQTADKDLNNLPAGTKATLVVTARNTGNTTWSNTGPNPIRIATSNPDARASAFESDAWLNSVTTSTLNQPSVAPGENGSFTIVIQAPRQPGFYREYFSPLVHGIGWMNNIGLHWNITVTEPTLAGTVVGSNYPTTMAMNQTSTGTITIRNDSNIIWYRDARFPMKLGTSQPLGRTSPFANGSWPSTNRLSRQNEELVSPGANATFNFSITAPHQPGNYAETYSLVAEGFSWFNQVITNNVNVPAAYFATSPGNSSENIASGESRQVTLSFVNNGTSTWTNSGTGAVKLRTSPGGRVSPFCNDSSWENCTTADTLNEASVAPGQTGTFTFTLEAPALTGAYQESFAPSSSGQEWFGGGTTITVNVAKPTYSWSWNSQAAYTDSTKLAAVDLSNMSPGQTAWLVVKANNIGNKTWFNSGSNPVRIGTAGPLERGSRFATGAWIKTSRPASMTEASVAPGGVATFEFPITVPAGGGRYAENFNLLAENLTWMNENVGQFFAITVKDKYAWSWKSQAAYTDSAKNTSKDLSNMNPGDTAWLVVEANNIGTATWLKAGNYPLRIGTAHPLERISRFSTGAWIRPSTRPAVMNEASVAPGQSGTFEFPITVPAGGGIYREYFNLVAESLTWLNEDVGQFFPITVK
ncbi:MAG TPA: NBR1-Ig-like domain-containing protein, partial [Candidatus Dormibacteraeota bacterium]|nr:NBR1-Ig-like domain-containing protein [Candidatus Dormibacteraeota bacterium]